MKRIFLSIFAVIFPFVVFLILDLPGAALVAIGLQSTIIGWPVAIVWAFKYVIKTCEEDKLKRTAAAAAAAAEASEKIKAAAKSAAEKSQEKNT